MRRSFAQYGAELLPNVPKRVELLRHKLLDRLAGQWFQSHIQRIRDYAFSEAIHSDFAATHSTSQRLAVAYCLSALLHWRVATEDDSVHTARKLLRQVHTFTATEAVYMYEDDFNPRVEKELQRVWRSLLHATWDWQQDSRLQHYESTVAEEVFRGDLTPAHTAVAHLSSVHQYLCSLPWTDVVDNAIDWHVPKS